MGLGGRNDWGRGRGGTGECGFERPCDGTVEMRVCDADDDFSIPTLDSDMLCYTPCSSSALHRGSKCLIETTNPEKKN